MAKSEPKRLTALERSASSLFVRYTPRSRTISSIFQRPPCTPCCNSSGILAPGRSAASSSGGSSIAPRTTKDERPAHVWRLCARHMNRVRFVVDELDVEAPLLRDVLRCMLHTLVFQRA